MISYKRVKIPIKILSCILAISTFFVSIPTFSSLNAKAADVPTILSTFTVTNTIGQVVKDAEIKVFADEDRTDELISEKTDETGVIKFEINEMDIYYYTVSADDMISQTGFFTKTEPDVSIELVNSARCHTCDGTGMVECHVCSGKGLIVSEQDCTNCENGKVMVTCTECNGINSDSCLTCNGTGLMSVDCEICNGTGKITITTQCSSCKGSKEVICTECSGNQYVPAYDFEFKFDKDVNLQRNSKNIENPVSVEENTSNGTITYVSSDENVVTVDSDGKLTAKGNAGQTAVITATIAFDKENGYAPKTTSCLVKITPEDNFISQFDVFANLIYTGEAQNLIAPKDNADVDKESLVIDVYNSNGEKVESAIDAGEYTVEVSDANHNIDSTNVTIEPAEITVKPWPDQTKYFGENAEIGYDKLNVPEKGVDPVFSGVLSYESADELIHSEDPAAVDEEGLSVITQGSLALDATILSNKNYTLKFDNSDGIKINVIMADYEEVLMPVDAQQNQYWFNKSYLESHNGKVVFKAPEGYKISKERRNFSDEVSFTDEGKYDNQILYLQKNDKTLFSKIFGGKVEKVSVSFGIDVTCPQFTAEFDAKNDSFFASIGRLLGFGAYFNKQVVLSVSAKDTGNESSALKDGSGVSDIQVVLNNGTADQQNFEQNRDGIFVLAEDTDTIKGAVYVTVTDEAGNMNFNDCGRELVSTENSNLSNEDCVIMLENTKPSIGDIKVTPVDENRPSEYIFNGKNVYSSDVMFSFTVQDQDSGIYYTDVTINGKNVNEVLSKDDQLNVGPFVDNKQTDQFSHSVRTADEKGAYKFEADENGAYTIVVKSSDAAGNVSEKTETIYVDRHAPIVNSFEITGTTGTIDDSGAPHNVILTDYGFYFKDSANVKVTFGDYKEEKELLSGLSKALIYLVDKDGTIYRVTESGTITDKNEAGQSITSIENDIIPISLKSETDNNGDDIASFIFEVNKNFKGQIYAMAIDKTGNTLVNGATAPTNSSEILGEALSYNTYGFQKPSGSIIENEDKHNSSYTIDITAPKTSNKDINGYPLYNDPETQGIDIDLLVKDSYSGIKSIEVSVNAPYDKANNYSYKVTVGSDAESDTALTYEGDDRENDWSIDEKDENLATVMSNTINVTNNSNGIEIFVKLTDRAGNESTDRYIISIDKSAPEIEVLYNNNHAENNSYYQDDRTATVIVRELNLSLPSQITVDATRDGQDIAPTEYEIQQLIKNVYESDNYDQYHKVVGDGENEREYYEFSFTIRGNIQGDYSITVASVDNAGNLDTYNRVDKFSVDNTTPFITVSFDNNNAQNGNYYSKERVATITVTDRYFDSTNTSILVNAADNGVSFASPQASNWSVQNGDYEQSCTVVFDRDGTYSLTLDSTDLSGKVASQYVVSDFIVDLTAPSIDITINNEQIENGSSHAYIDQVVPQVVIRDTNFSDTDTQVMLTPVIQKDGTNLVYDNKIVSENMDFVNGMTYNYNNFQGDDGNERKYDNIYILEVSTVDKAGNTTEPQRIIFSVNRYGSTYYFDIEKYYVDQPVIQIEEVNVNSLDFENEETYITVTSLSGATTTFSSKDLVVETREATDTNWYSYVYAIPSDTFNVDDVYSVKLSSRDTANRLSTNLNNANNQEISFTVDTTNPYFEVVNYIENESLQESEYELIIDIMDDTSGVAKYSITFDGQQAVEPYVTKTYENKIEVRVPIKGATQLSQASGRELKVEITDAAGRTNYSADNDNSTFNVRISSSFFVDALAHLQDFYHNTVAFWCTVAGVIVVLGILLWVLLAKRKKKNEDKESAV